MLNEVHTWKWKQKKGKVEIGQIVSGRPWGHTCELAIRAWIHGVTQKTDLFSAALKAV